MCWHGVCVEHSPPLIGKTHIQTRTCRWATPRLMSVYTCSWDVKKSSMLNCNTSFHYPCHCYQLFFKGSMLLTYKHVSGYPQFPLTNVYTSNNKWCLLTYGSSHVLLCSEWRCHLPGSKPVVIRHYCGYWWPAWAQIGCDRCLKLIHTAKKLTQCKHYLQASAESHSTCYYYCSTLQHQFLQMENS